MVYEFAVIMNSGVIGKEFFNLVRRSVSFLFRLNMLLLPRFVLQYRSDALNVARLLPEHVAKIDEPWA